MNQKYCFITGPSVSFEQLRTSVFDVVGSDPVEANSGTASDTSSANKKVRICDTVIQRSLKSYFNYRTYK